MTLTQAEAYALTLVVEASAAALIAPWFAAKRARAALAAAEASALTHPFVWAAVYALYDTLQGLTIPLIESAVMGVEASFYRVLAVRRWRDALFFSIIINATSWGLGALVVALF